MTWRLARAIETLRAEVNKAHPSRPKGADGTIGDDRHAATKSDHNPVAPHAGVVTAWDITTAPFTDALAEKLRALGKAGDKRVKYVIYKGRIASRTDNWAWRKYTGYSQHFDHIHLSVSDDPKFYDSTAPWLTAKPAAQKAAPAGKTNPYLAFGESGEINRDSHGGPVRFVQWAVGTPCSGTWDSETEHRVRELQHKHGRPVTGFVGAAADDWTRRFLKGVTR